MLSLPANPKILVIGDVMADTYVYGSVGRISPEAPCQVLDYSDSELWPGGAANVAMALGGDFRMTGIAGALGADAPGHAVAETLEKNGIDTALLRTEEGKSTTHKIRFIAGAGTQLLRLDRDSHCDRQIGTELEDWLGGMLPFWDKDIVLIVDYNKGMITRQVVKRILRAARPGSFVGADMKVADPELYEGVDMLKGNRSEMMRMACACGYAGNKLPAALKKVKSVCKVRYAVATCGAGGMKGIGPDGVVVDVEAKKCSPHDVTGAGDITMAWLTMALAGGTPLEEAMRFAASGASLYVAAEKRRYPAAAEIALGLGKELPPGFLRYYRLPSEGLVFTNGCFDILHAGHVDLLRNARALGRRLIVGINTDDSVRRLKGESRPINTLDARIEMLKALDCVDAVIPFDTDTPEELITTLSPEILVKGGDYREEEIAGAGYVKKNGGKVVILPHNFKLSSTSIVEKIINRPER